MGFSILEPLLSSYVVSGIFVRVIVWDFSLHRDCCFGVVVTLGIH